MWCVNSVRESARGGEDGSSGAGVPDHCAQRFGYHSAGRGIDSISASVVNSTIFSDLQQTQDSGMDIYAIPAVPLYTKPVNVNLMGGFKWLGRAW